MANTQEFTTIIRLNDSEAKNSLQELKRKVEDLTAARDKAIAAKADSNFIKDINKDLKAARAELRSYDTNVRKTIDTVNNLSEATLGDVEKAMRAVRTEMKKTSDPDDFRRLNNILEQCKDRVDEIKGAVSASNEEIRKMVNDAQLAANVVGNINGSSVNDLKSAQSTIESRMAGLSPSSTAYARQNEDLLKIKARLAEIAEKQRVVNTVIEQYNNELEKAGQESRTVASNTELVNRTLKSLDRSSVRDLEYSLKIVNEQLRGMDRGTEEFRQMTRQSRRLQAQLQAVRTEGAAQQSWIGKAADGFNRMQAMTMTAIAAITGLSLTIRKCVEDFAKMEDVLANVRKYTGQTDSQVREMNEDFKKMDTRTSREQLNELAGAAGRLGITSTQMIEEFVDGADKIGVALGDDLGEGAVEKIGKLAQIFGEDKTKGLRGAMYATGSAVNELAQNSSANAGYIVDFTADLAGVGKQANMTQAQIMGLASALDQNMQEESTASTVFSQLITKMFQDPAKFAKLAGENVKKFSQLLKTDANAALLQFLSAMKSKGGFSEMAPMFESMNLNGTRAVGVLSSVASHLDQVKTAQALATREYGKGTSVINEFNIQNETVGAQLDKAKKRFSDLSIELGQKLMPVARYTISRGSDLVHLLSNLIDFVSKYKVTIATLIVAITALTIVEEADVIKKKLQAFWNNAVIASCKKLWAVLVANPYTAIAGAVAIVVGLIIDLTRQTNKQIDTQKELNEIQKQASEKTAEQTLKVRLLEKAMNNGNLSMTERKKAAEQLNAIIPDYNAHLDNTRKRYVANKQKLDDYIQSLMRMYEIMGAKEKLQSLGKEKADATLELKSAQDDYRKTIELQKKTTEVNRKSMLAPTQAETQMLSSNITRAESKVKEAQEKVNAITVKAKAIESVYGTDMQKAELQKPEGKTDEGTGGGGMTDKEKKSLEKKQKAREAAEKKEEVAAEKRKKEADRKEQSATNLELANLATEYARGTITYQEFIDKKEEILKKGLENRKRLWKSGSREYDDILRSEEKATQDHDEEKLKMNLKAIEIEQQQRDAAIKAQYYNKDSKIYMDEDAVNEALFQSDQEALKKKQKLYGQGTEDWLELQSELEDNERQHQLDNEENYLQKLSQYREEWGRKDLQEQETITLKGLDSLYKKGLIKEKEYQEMRKNIRLQFAREKSEEADRNSLRSRTAENANTAYQAASNNAYANEGTEAETSVGSYLTGDITHYKDTMAQLQELYKSDSISYAEYQQAKSQATSQFAKDMVSKIQTAYESVAQVMSAMSSYYSAQSEYEQNIVTKKYEKLEGAAGSNSTKTKALEEKKEKEIAKIKSKYNKKQMKIELAQATATMIIGAMNAYSSAYEGTPYPANLVLAPIAAGIAMAAGMLNLAAIKKQHQAEEAGYYEGGFTGGSDYRKKAGIVHEGEFVANHTALANTAIMPALQLIDQAQKNNTVGSLTAADVSRSVGGGNTVVSAPTVNVSTDNSELSGTIGALSNIMDQLQRQLSQGIQASVSIDGRNGVKRQLDLFNRLNNNK